jgi:peptidyl-prolyl cis-trans isomerase SurA
MSRITALFSSVLALVPFCLVSSSQGGEPQRLDGIAAVIGDEVILQSDLNAYLALRLGGLNIKPADSADVAKYRSQFLNEMIDGKVLLVHAKNDTTVSVSNDEVEQAVQNHIVSILAQNSISMDSLEVLLKRDQGMTLAKFKAEARSAIREQLLKQKVQRTYLSAIKVSRRDVEQFFAQYRDSLPKAGESVLLSKLSIEVAPSPAVRQAAYEKALAIKKRLDAGADFAELAKKSSDGPEAAEGGDLGFIAKGSLTELAFEEKAFSLRVGQTSDPFESRLGFHIINVVAKQDQKVHIRQIFIKVAPPEALVKKSTAFLDSLRAMCTTSAAFTAAVQRYSSDKLSKVNNGRIGWKTLAELPAPVRTAIDTLGPGSITPVVNDNKELMIVRIDDRVKTRALTLEDDWPVLADKAKDIAAQKKLIDLVARWRRQVFISVKL